jgi:hypothetical protein
VLVTASYVMRPILRVSLRSPPRRTSMALPRGMVPDEEILGTLVMGHMPPSLLQAFIFIAVV